MKFETDRPTPNTTEAHKTRLADMNLKYGSTSVYRDRKGTYWATGDFAHSGKDIDHNIKSMVAIMRAEGLTHMGKAYDSDTYKSKVRISDKIWEKICATDRLTAVNPELPIEVVKGG